MAVKAKRAWPPADFAAQARNGQGNLARPESTADPLLGERDQFQGRGQMLRLLRADKDRDYLATFRKAALVFLYSCQSKLRTNLQAHSTPRKKRSAFSLSDIEKLSQL